MRIRTNKRWRARAVKSMLALSALALPASAANPDYVAQGYWEAVMGMGVYPTYLKISGDSGYYCVLDDKSGFRFKIIGDSITTPFNGMNRITYFWGSGDIQTDGEEKGEAYSVRFRSIEPAVYPKACIDEEAEWYGEGTVKLAAPVPANTFLPLRKRLFFDLLGRQSTRRHQLQ